MIDETDFGVYECEATNDMGTIKREILLKKGGDIFHYFSKTWFVILSSIETTF